MRYSPAVFLAVAALSMVRVLLPLDLNWAYQITSHNIIPLFFSIVRSDQLGGVPLWQWLLMIWAVVGLIFLLRGVLSSIRFARVMESLPRIKDPEALRIAQSLGLKPEQLVVAQGVPAPMVVGFFHHVIYLPPMELSGEDQAWILKHEITHIRLHDSLWKLLVLVLQSALWWNPIVYLFTCEMDSILEMRCDQAMLRGRSHTERTAYAKTLFQVANILCPQKVRYPSSAATFLQRRGGTELILRIKLVLNRKAPCRGAGIAAIALCLALFVASYFVVPVPSGGPPPEDLMEEVVITPENAYITKDAAGIYHLWVNETCIDTIPEDEMDTPPHNILPIYQKGEQ